MNWRKRAGSEVMMRLRVLEEHQTQGEGTEAGTQMGHIWGPGSLGSGTSWGEPAPNCGSFKWHVLNRGPASISSNLQHGSSWCRRTSSNHSCRAAPTGTSNSSLCSQKSRSRGLSSQDKWSHLYLQRGVVCKQSWIQEATSCHLST